MRGPKTAHNVEDSVNLVTVVFWFERAFGSDAYVIGLIFGQFGQFC